MKHSCELTLAIDAAVAGGSLSLIQGTVEVANWIGSANVSRAETILSNVDSILATSMLSARVINLVAVSVGPGSFTGIRLGMATSLGLATGLGVGIANESALKAMAFQRLGHNKLIVAVPSGRRRVCYQMFDTSNGVIELSKPCLGQEIDFLSTVTEVYDSTFLLHEDIFEKVNAKEHAINFGKNIALAVGMVCASESPNQNKPLFLD